MLMCLPYVIRDPPTLNLSIFSRPPTDCIQIYFDRASKGNLDCAADGGIFRSSRGTMTGVFVGYYGHTINNVGEFLALEKGLILDGKQDFLRIHIVGNSKMVVQMAQNIINGSPSCKITKR